MTGCAAGGLQTPCSRTTITSAPTSSITCTCARRRASCTPCRIWSTSGSRRPPRSSWTPSEKRSRSTACGVRPSTFGQRFFGPEWTAVVPSTCPVIAEADEASAERCWFDQAAATAFVPWDKSIAMYSPVHTQAAVTIQRHFRGWRVRMRTAFDPNTRIGAYYALREFHTNLFSLTTGGRGGGVTAKA